MNNDAATLAAIHGAIVRTHASEFGFVEANAITAAPSYAWAQPIFGESERGDWSGTMHEPFDGWKATNIHVSDSWVLSDLTSKYGKCYRVLDSDIHFFSDRPRGEIDAWLSSLPDRNAPPPGRAVIAGYPYGNRDGNPVADEGQYSGIGHETGRPDCHWYNRFRTPNAGGKSGSPCFAIVDGVTDERAFGINVARGYTWEDGPNHWAVIQCYHNAMKVEAAL